MPPDPANQFEFSVSTTPTQPQQPDTITVQTGNAAGVDIEISTADLEEGEVYVPITGPPGKDGDDGAPGVRGSLWFESAGPPGVITGALPNDQYLDTSTADVYVLIGSVWTRVANIKGVPGQQGGVGPPGEDGQSQATFVFTQASALASWTISHGLGRYPSVTVVDSTEREVEGDVNYIDSSNLVINFTAPFSGVAYLN